MVWFPCLRNTRILWLFLPWPCGGSKFAGIFLSSHFPPHFYSFWCFFFMAVCPVSIYPLGLGTSGSQPLHPFLELLLLLEFFIFPQCCVIEFCEFSPPADLIPLVLPCRAWLELRNVWDGNWNHPGFTRTWSLEFSSQSKNYINPAQCEGNKQDLKPRSVQNLNGADREVIPKLSREMGAVCSEGCVRNCWIFVFSECSGQNTQVPDCPGIQIPDILSYIYKYLEI